MRISEARRHPPTWKKVRLILAFGLAVLALTARGHDQSSGILRYQGFVVDISQIEEIPALDEVEAGVRRQVDMVDSVGVSNDVLKFFHSVPVRIVPPAQKLASEEAFYSPSDRDIQLSTNLLELGHRPILLHELLHAFQVQFLDHGIYNVSVIQFYHDAESGGLYPSKSHMMLNSREFFACAGTTYLFGVTAQAPFDRDGLRMTQPKYYSYIKSLFGPDSGKFVGSLTP